MSFAPIALTTPQYENFPNQFLKAFIQGTATPLAMATDATGGTTLAKAELDSTGFPITAGNARFIPFIDGDYDLWLFPTAAEADANDTTNAIQFADDLNTDPLSDVSQDYDKRYGTIFATVAAVQAVNPVSIDGIVVDLVAGMSLSTQVHTLSPALGGGGAGDYLVVAGDSSNGVDKLLLASGDTMVLQHNGTVDLRQVGAIADNVFTEDDPSFPSITSTGTDNYDAIRNAMAAGLNIEAAGEFGFAVLTGRDTTGYFRFSVEGQTFKGGTFSSLTTPTATGIVWGLFVTTDVTTCHGQDMLVRGVGNAGSNGSILDGFGIIQSDNCTFSNCFTDYTKRHGFFLMESNDNRFHNIGARRCNRQNLGVGVQLQGSGFNFFNDVNIKDVGSNGVDYNKSSVGSQDATRYNVTNTGEVSISNNMFGLAVRGAGVNNINVSGGDPLTTVIADDDYYGINLIQGSDFNIFQVAMLENIGVDLPVGGDTFVSAIRIFDADNNQITVDKLENIDSGVGAILKVDTLTSGNIIEIGKTKTVGPALHASSEMASLNKMVVGDLVGYGRLQGTEFKYISNTATTNADGIIDGWENNFGFTVDAVNNELTMTGTGSSGKFIQQDDAFDSEFAVISFEYKTTGTPATGAAIGQQDAPFDTAILPESAAFVQTFALIGVSTDGATDVTIWPDLGDNTGRTLTIRKMAMYSSDGELLNTRDIPRLRDFPIAGTYEAGDYVKNIVATVGQPKGWYCTVAGTPGTWVSEGNL